MPGSLTLVRIMKSTLATLLLLGLLGATAAAAQATNGTIKAIKGGDRKLGEASNRTYALPVAGARFEYTSSETKAEDPASSGWTAFPSTTGADGTATVSVQAGTYYVREQAVPGGFSGFGPVKRLFHDPSSGVPATAKPYVAKVVVEHGQVTEAYPNRSGSGDADDWSSTSGGDTGSPFVGVRDNATFPSSCGINILMVLDRSGSIAPYKSAYRDAARAFVGALDGTPTQIGILSFSAGDGGVSSYQDGSGSASRTHSPLDLGVAGNTATLKGTIDSVYDSPGGGTNWDRALQKASQAKGFVNNAGTGQTTNPDVVVFITDGNPTARSTDGSDSGSGVDLIDLTAGMASANVVKSQSARAGKKLKLYALGVGSGVTPGNLAAVSGPVAGEDYETPTIAELTAKLTELAARTCGARVFVRKRLAGNGADQPDWGFSATSNGGAIGYLDGDRRTHASTSGAIETGVLLTQLPAGGREVTVTEDAAGQPLGDFNLDGVACRTGGYDGAPVVPVATTAMGVKLSVQRGSAIYCTFTNSPKAPKLNVVKTPDDQTIDAGQDAEFAIVVTNTGSGTARNVALSDTLPSAGSWTISANPGGCSIAGGVLSCAFGDVPAGASRTVKVTTATSNEACAVYVNPAATASATNAATASDGGRITCRKDAKVTVVKQLAPTSDAGRFDLKVGGAVVAANVGDGGQGSAFVDPGTHAVSETGAGATDLAAYDKSIACVKNGVPAESGGGASLDITVGYGDVVVCTIANKRLPAGIGVVKDGPRFAYPGDTATFAFAVTNRGSAPLTDVVVTDDRCAPVTRSSGDELLDPGETWIFTCSKQIPPGHRIGDENPIRNVATATGEDPLGQTLTAQDDHVVHVLHPAVDIDKSGPATAVLGTALAYTLTVTNPGDVPFASQQVVVTDPRCEAPPAGPSTGGDATPGQLDPGEAWTYTCTAQTTGQPAGTFVNTATVTAKDFNGRPVTDSDDFRTMLETQQVLAGPAIANGSARLRGPSGCVRTRFRATVRGSRIAQVTFYRDGKRIKRIVAKPGQRAFTVKLEPARAQGVHRITAKVRFDGGSKTRTRTLRLSYQRCRKQVVRPRFTG